MVSEAEDASVAKEGGEVVFGDIRDVWRQKALEKKQKLAEFEEYKQQPTELPLEQIRQKQRKLETQALKASIEVAPDEQLRAEAAKLRTLVMGFILKDRHRTTLKQSVISAEVVLTNMHIIKPALENFFTHLNQYIDGEVSKRINYQDDPAMIGHLDVIGAWAIKVFGLQGKDRTEKLLRLQEDLKKAYVFFTVPKEIRELQPKSVGYLRRLGMAWRNQHLV